MSGTLKTPLGANFAGRVWVGAISFVATPLYLRWLGVEGFGVIGFYLLLVALAGFFTTAIMDSATREIAACPSGESPRAIIAGFRRVAWIVGIVIGLVTAVGSELMADHWLAAGTLGAPAMHRAMLLMAPNLALQVPLDFYVGVLLGVHRHVAANVIFAGTATARLVVTALALELGGRSLEWFFVAQLAGSVVMTAAAEFLIRSPSQGPSPTTPWQAVRQGWRFSTGMTVIAVSGLVLSQADRIVLSRALPLEQFGVYSLATTAANLLYFVISPVRSAYFSELTRHAAAGDEAATAATYHGACQRMAVLVMPVAMVLLLFPREFIGAWTGRPEIAVQAAPVVAFLVAARIVSAINSLPYTLQFAHAWTSLVARTNLVAIVVFVPLLAVMAQRYGAVGAAMAYFYASVPFLFIIVWRMHRRLLRTELARWFWRDTLPPMLVAAAIAGAWKLMEPGAMGRWSQFTWLAAAGGSALAAVAFVNADVRHQVQRWWSEVR